MEVVEVMEVGEVREVEELRGAVLESKTDLL